MTDPGDDLSRRYRELAREEPPAAVDAAIMAAARRAVQPHSRMRWAMPVSIAAVLVLGIGVALRMQVEQPGVETSMPQSSSSAEYPMPQTAEPAPPAKPQAAEAPAPPERQAEKRAAPKALAKRVEPQALPASPPPAVLADAPVAAAPSRSQTITTTTSNALPESAAPAAAPRMKREAFAADAVQQREARDEREVELERIARLRAENRHEDADKALEEFRRRHPDYRIAPAMWERVKPR